MVVHPQLCSHHFNAHLRFSLESGCKITALQHILQIYLPLFFQGKCNISPNSLILKRCRKA